ncbi:MAG: ABC transporter substrate-binding protein [bacterium JZ-2024 1]
MRRFLGVFFLFPLLLSGCKRRPPGTQEIAEKETVKIGVILPMTGTVSGFGQQTWTGIQLAQKQKPEVLKKKVELILCDEKSDKTESANCAQRLIQKEGVIALLGSVPSSNTMAIGAVAEANRVPLVTPSSTNPLVTQGKKYVFRACFVDTFQGEVLARFAREHLHAKSAALLTDVAQDYSAGLSRFFLQKFQSAGGTVTELKYQTGDQEFSSQLTQIRHLKPDVLVATGYYPEIAMIALQARSLGIRIPILAGDGAEDSRLIEIGGKSVEGLYFSTHFDEKMATTEIQVNYTKLFRDMYQKPIDGLAALGIDGYLILVDAIERAGVLDREKIRDMLDQTKDFQGVTGKITLIHGDAVKPAVIRKVENGTFVYVTTIYPAG